MKRTLTAVGASLVALTAAPAAMAQQAKSDFGQQGQFIIGADRLLSFFGYSHYSYDLPTGPNLTKNNVSFSRRRSRSSTGRTPTRASGAWAAFGQRGGDRLLRQQPRLHRSARRPRLRDRAERDHRRRHRPLLHARRQHVDASRTSTGGTNMTRAPDNPGITLFGIAPRGGYILGLNDMFSLWLRGGFSYYTWTAKQTVTTTRRTRPARTSRRSTSSRRSCSRHPARRVHGWADDGHPLRRRLVGLAGENGADPEQSGGASILYFGLTMGMLAYF